MIVGNITTRVVEFPLIGKPSIIIQLLDSNGSPVVITNDVTIAASVYHDTGDASALFSKTSGAGQITVLNVDGYVLIALADADVLLLSPQWVYSLQVKLLDAIDGTTIKCVNTVDILPVNNPQYWTQPTEVTMALSTTYLNTKILLGEAGGAGYLDGIQTLTQPVGCMLEFTITNDVDTPPATWQLQVWTDQVDLTGAWRKPTDFNASTNAKIWRKIS